MQTRRRRFADPIGRPGAAHCFSRTVKNAAVATWQARSGAEWLRLRPRLGIDTRIRWIPVNFARMLEILQNKADPRGKLPCLK